MVKSQRTERLVRMAARFFVSPRRVVSLTDLAGDFEISKTVVSDDIEIIDGALRSEGIGEVVVDRGRTGGAHFIPRLSEGLREQRLGEIARLLSAPERSLPGGLVYYGDLIFDPRCASVLGFAMASVFSDLDADVIMTSEVKGIPIAQFAAYALGIPLAVCRFRNRPSDGSAVAVHFPTGSGDVRTMYLGTRQLSRGRRVLILDDFMRGGSTAAGMLQMAREFGAEVVGIGVFLASEEPREKAVSNYRALLRLTRQEGRWQVSVAPSPDPAV